MSIRQSRTAWSTSRWANTVCVSLNCSVASSTAHNYMPEASLDIAICGHFSSLDKTGKQLRTGTLRRASQGTPTPRLTWYDMIYLLTAIGLPPAGSSTVHIYTQAVHRTTQNKQYIEQHNNFENNTKILEECGPCPDLARYTLAFALQLRKKHGKTSVRVFEQ
jgi:hypothetical protein